MHNRNTDLGTRRRISNPKNGPSDTNRHTLYPEIGGRREISKRKMCTNSQVPGWWAPSPLCVVGRAPLCLTRSLWDRSE